MRKLSSINCLYDSVGGLAENTVGILHFSLKNISIAQLISTIAPILPWSYLSVNLKKTSLSMVTPAKFTCDNIIFVKITSKSPLNFKYFLCINYS